LSSAFFRRSIPAVKGPEAIMIGFLRVRPEKEIILCPLCVMIGKPSRKIPVVPENV
jgi:hypothetical protein